MMKAQPDKLLCLALFCLIIFGLVMISSASFVLGFVRYDDPFYFPKKQIQSTIVGAVCMWAAYGLAPRDWSRVSPILIGLTYTLLFLVLVPGIGPVINGSQRWLRIGPFSFQPSELAKITIVVYLASYLARKGTQVKRFFNGLLPPILVVTGIMLMILMEPDIGTAALVGMVSISMLFLGGARIRHLVVLGAFFFYILLMQVMSNEYPIERIMAYLNPSYNPGGVGYQTIVSLNAFSSGGLLGVGLGEGVHKFSLPEAHTEFIFAVIGEELGLVGIASVVIIFVVLLWRWYRIVLRVPDPFTENLVKGIGIMISIQALINILVVTGLFPITGMPLPFMSYGGTSLIVSMVMGGMLLRLSSEASPVKKER